ncbi:hypothetical protein HMP0015_2430 [Acinetobacter haemolyticus ATCC 19194]|uniref:Peptidase C39-like domain-containing protein n=1 Tax=Acinetobacter haemolyticus ATCC 19194 TaxID=707232 RepID=D4XRT8_ACIHA|nr:hypothetical protein [Acinetobacter haemolyticus]EFF82148.1 hypothetical protein HMP0015_2430 [Acinetobacter haemolyticus ATCC 19194]
MKKVMQTVTGFGGNCEGATLATLLRMKIEDIPSFWEGIDITKPPSDEGGVIYQKNLNKFLAKHGYKSISLGWEEPTEESVQWVEEISKQIGVKHLVAGMSPRGYMHSVIYEQGKLWHDPHPEGGGVIPCQIQFLMPIFENVRDDYVVVPLAPTPKMIDSTWNDQDKIETMSHNARNEFIYKKMIYAAMIEAARGGNE